MPECSGADLEARQVQTLAETLVGLGTRGFDGFWARPCAAGMPLTTGLCIMACTGAVVGYLAVPLLWRDGRR